MDRQGCKKGSKKAANTVQFPETGYAMPLRALMEKDALNYGHLDKLHFKSVMVIFSLNKTFFVG